MNKLKIGVIGLKGLPAFGGAATVGENIINELRDDYSFFVYASASHADEKYIPEGFTQIVFKKFFIQKLNIFFYYLCSALHSVFKAKYDMIHLHHVDGAFILPILRLKYKVICTSHAQPQVNEKWSATVRLFFKMNERIALRMSNIFTVVSLPLRESIRKISAREILYIPNGINLKQKITEGLPVNERYLLFAAGRIIPLKGLHTLIEAYAKGKFVQKLVVIGSLEHLPSYKEEILKTSDGLNILFVPLIKEKEKLLQYVKHADLFIFPSSSEAMSIMLLEAAFTMVPVVCSDIEANTAIFDETEFLFFRTNDSSDLREKMKFALDHKDHMKSKIEKAYNKLIEKYNWPIIARQYALQYSRLISSKKRFSSI
jgi:glycosyltransferase involved in cell wall biosynthesis